MLYLKMMQDNSIKKAIRKLINLINLEKKEISSVYSYAIFSGIILLSLPLGIQAIINLLFGGTVSTSLIILIIIVVAGVFLNGLLQIAQMRATERIQQRIFTRLTFAYAFRIPKINLLSIDNYYLPELVNRFFDTASLQKGISKLLLDFPAASIQIVFGLVLLSFYHPIFIVFGFLLLALVIWIFYLTSPEGFASSIKESDYKFDVAHWLEEISRSIKTFKFFQHNDLHLRKTDELVNGYLQSREKHFSVLLFQYKIVIAFKVLITAAMLIMGSVLFINQQINLGQFIATEIIILTIINSIEKLIVSLEVVYDVLTALEKINKVLEKPQDADDSLVALNQWSDNGGIDIKFNNLSFGFNEKTNILNNMNLHIKAGEKVCISGSEGSGKTTLLKMLTGMYLNFSGNILYNNIPIKSVKTEILHKSIGIYLTEEELFSGSLLDNITLGSNDIDYTNLNNICTLVGLAEFVMSKQEGFGYLLDPQGKKLSYNIAQKILIARSIYFKPQLLLMDDGWMSLEEEVKSRISNYLIADEKCTLIAISNDDDFAKKCDRQIRLANGFII